MSLKDKILTKTASRIHTRMYRGVETGLTVGVGGVGASMLKDKIDDQKKKKKSKKMKMQKIAELSEGKKDIMHTATIAGLGGLGTLAGNAIIHHTKVPGVGLKALGIGTGLALATDYAAVKFNKHMDNSLKKTASETGNKYLEKIVETHKE